MRNTKGSRRIVVQNAEYRWRATGNDGYITIGIWPTNNVGAFIYANLGYHSIMASNCDGSSSAVDQIVITSRIIRRIIEYTIVEHRYDPNAAGKELHLRAIDEIIKWDDAVRTSDKPNQTN